MKNIAVVFAGGTGQRMGIKDVPKQFLEVEGKPVIIYTLEHFQNHPEIDEIYVVCIEPWIDYLNYQLDKFGITKVKSVVPGGKTGQDSIYLGLKEAEKYCSPEDVVLIHDGARPYVTLKNLQDIKACLTHCDACLLAVPCVDTIKVVKDGVVVQTPKRSDLWNAQTPQAFKTSLIQDAYQKSFDLKIEVSDDASCVELCTDVPVHIVPGDYQNIKITNPQDLKLQK